LTTLHQDDVDPRPRGLAWAAVARLATVALFFDGIGPLLPRMAAAYQLPDDIFQLLLGACEIVFACFLLVSVPIIRMIGLYRASALSCLYLGLSAALICVTRNTCLFAALFISMFAINSIGSNATRVALRKVTSNEEYKRLFAWAMGCVEIKQIAMPIVTGMIAVALGWRWAFIAIVSPVVMVGMWIEWAHKKQPNGHRPTESHRPGVSHWRAVAAMPSFLAPTLIAAAFQVAFSPLGTRLPFILANEAHLTPSMVGLFLSIDSAAIAISLFLSGYLASHWSSHLLIKAGIFVMLTGLSIMAIGYFSDIYWLISGIIVVTAAYGFIVVPCSADAMNVAEEHRTVASALLGFVQPVVGGLSVAYATAFGASQVGGSIALTILSFGLVAAASITMLKRRKL
jgi:predicted MFS family arabinose efflux permease